MRSVVSRSDESLCFIDLKQKLREGYARKPIFHFIPFSSCFIETLNESIIIQMNILNLIVRELTTINTKTIIWNLIIWKKFI